MTSLNNNQCVQIELIHKRKPRMNKELKIENPKVRSETRCFLNAIQTHDPPCVFHLPVSQKKYTCVFLEPFLCNEGYKWRAEQRNKFSNLQVLP